MEAGEGEAVQDNDNREFYLDIAKFEVQAIAQRNQMLLVFQSILFAAFGAAIGRSELFFPVWLLMALGVATCLLWLYLNALTRCIENGAMQNLLSIDMRLAQLLDARKKSILLRIGSVSKIMAFGFPCLVLATWLLLLYFYSA